MAGTGALGGGLSLKARALQLLAQREHSASELRRKLMRHLAKPAARRSPARPAEPAAADSAEAGNRLQADDGAQAEEASATDAQQVEDVIAWLVEHRHLCEERFIESRIHLQAPRFGTARIRHELARHGLALDVQAQQQLQASEEERALEVWRRKFGAAPPVDAASQARQARFLAQRGFSSDAIRRVLKAAARG